MSDQTPRDRASQAPPASERGPEPEGGPRPEDGPGSVAGPEPGTGPELPDAPLFALLRTIADEIGVHTIDRVWLFPPRRLKAGETSVLVVSAFHELDDQRRRVHAAQYTAPADPKAEPRLTVDEFGAAPADRVGRLVEEVVERIKEDAPAGPPRAVDIDGQDGPWNVMLHELATRFLAEAEENPRLPGRP